MSVKETFKRAGQLAADVVEMPVRVLVEAYQASRAIGMSPPAALLLPVVFGQCSLMAALISGGIVNDIVHDFPAPQVDPNESPVVTFLVENPTLTATAFAAAVWGFSLVLKAKNNSKLRSEFGKDAVVPPLLPRFSGQRPN